MDSWFTMDHLDDSTFVISEYKHWEQTHIYLLLGKRKALLIDTGLGILNIKPVIDQITSLPIEVVTTHVHWDHIGGHKYFNNISVHELEENWLTNFPLPLQIVKNQLCKEPCEFPIGFDLNEYQVSYSCATRILRDCDVFDLGDRIVQVIHTPGHSPGHICLYEPERSYLYTGDLVYAGTLYANYPSTDPKEFMRSVQKIKGLPIKRLMPAHDSLNIAVSLIEEISHGFNEIYSKGELRQGNELFSFKNFNILI